MPSATCKTCGRITNSATSNYWDDPVGEVSECYVAWEPDEKGQMKIVKGCGFKKADHLTRILMEGLLERSGGEGAVWKENSVE